MSSTPVTREQFEELRKKLTGAGLPASFEGDRLDAFRLGISVVLRHLDPEVAQKLLGEEQPEAARTP
jgi:hypothetical protein